MMTAITKIHKLYRTKVKPFASLIIALIVLIVYFYYALVSNRTPTGDEPHYVLATISLIKDHDLNLLNNYIAQDYLSFGQYDTLDIHGREYQKGILFPVHSYWFSLLLLPFYLIAELSGIYFFLASLLAVSIYLINKIMSFILAPEKQYLAYGSSLLFAFIVPFASSSITIYPSVPGTVLVLLSLYLYCKFLRTDKTAYLRYSLLTISTLEFLHHTYLIISVAWVIYLVFNHYHRLSKRDFLAIALVYLVWIVTPYCFGGDIFVGSQKGNFINPKTFFKQFAYHMFNLEVGLISNSPVYSLIFASPIILIILRKQVNVLSMQALQIAYVSVLCFYSFICLHQITPGESPIARYFVPVLPLLFIGIAYAISLSRFTELIFSIFLAYSFIIGIIIFDTKCNVLSCHSWIVERLEQLTGDRLLFKISYLENHDLVGMLIFIFFILTIAVNQLLIYNQKIEFKQ